MNTRLCKLRWAVAFVLCVPALHAQNTEYEYGGFGRYAEANAALTTTPRAVLFGDSITDGWPGQDAAFFTENRFVGRGISGQTSSQMLLRFHQDVVALKPRYVAILAGTNDIARNHGVIPNEITISNIIAMCEIARANGIRPVICSILPCSAYRWRPEVTDAVAQIDRINAALREYARSHRGVRYVDYNSPMRNAAGGLDPELSGDGCHPTLEGYRQMEAILLKALR